LQEIGRAAEDRVMADLLNLNKARKRKARAEAEALAAANRVKFGRTKAEKQRDAAAEADSARRLDGVKRERPAIDESSSGGDTR